MFRLWFFIFRSNLIRQIFIIFISPLLKWWFCQSQTVQLFKESGHLSCRPPRSTVYLKIAFKWLFPLKKEKSFDAQLQMSDVFRVEKLTFFSKQGRLPSGIYGMRLPCWPALVNGLMKLLLGWLAGQIRCFLIRFRQWTVLTLSSGLPTLNTCFFFFFTLFTCNLKFFYQVFVSFFYLLLNE